MSVSRNQSRLTVLVLLTAASVCDALEVISHYSRWPHQLQYIRLLDVNLALCSAGNEDAARVAQRDSRISDVQIRGKDARCAPDKNAGKVSQMPSVPKPKTRSSRKSRSHSAREAKCKATESGFSAELDAPEMRGVELLTE